MEHTSNYNLSQWAGEDRILREDFNADNAKIEAALDAVQALSNSAAKVVFGTYKGNEAASRTITLDFTPKIVILTTSYGHFYDGSSGTYGGIAGTNAPCKASSGNAIQVTTNGFLVHANYDTKAFTNLGSYTYYYVAIS